MAEVHEISPLIKEEILSIYKSFAAICQKYDIKHCVAFGTMLGAVRHNGFIPWDDDFDVFMLREDYEKFLTVADKELPEYFKVVSHRNCPAFPVNFSKIQESRKEIYEMIEEKEGYVSPTGLYIDIFPLDGVPSLWYEKIADFIRFISGYCRFLYLFRQEASIKGKIAKIIGYFLAPFFREQKSWNDFAFMLDKWLSKYPTSKKFIRVGRLEDRFQRKEIIFESSVVKETVLVLFENSEVPVPKDYDSVLRTLYGDTYMTPPPLEKRVSEHSKSAKAPWYYGPVKGD